MNRNQDVSERAWVGAEFFKLPEEKQKKLLSTGNMLFCRTEPKDKQRLVKMLQEMEEARASDIYISCVYLLSCT